MIARGLARSGLTLTFAGRVVDVVGRAKLLQSVLSIVAGGERAAAVGAAQPIAVAVVAVAGGKNAVLAHFGQTAGQIVGVTKCVRDPADGFALAHDAARS